ncbi:MAG: carbon-nitrogen hydrolase family protein [Caulobacterales bacterium]
MRPFALAALQIDLLRGDNTERLAKEIIAAARLYPFVEMVVLGELCWFGPDVAAAQTLPGPAEARMCEIAREAGVWLVAGSLYERDGDKVFNTCPVINPAGEVVARHRKIYPFTPYEAGVASGETCTVFEVPGVGRFGLSICYDMWFPETIRAMTWAGAEVILHPSMTNTIDRSAETEIARANAAMHQVYFVDLNVLEIGVGLSGVYGPGGEIIHRAGQSREIIVVELDLDHVTRVRERGWQGLGQVLKSYRDVDMAYPHYAKGPAASPALQALGPLRMPTKGPGHSS